MREKMNIPLKPMTNINRSAGNMHVLLWKLVYFNISVEWSRKLELLAQLTSHHLPGWLT